MICLSVFAEKNVIFSNCSNATMRIVDGPSQLEGRLEVCLNNVWGTICGRYNWDSYDAAVACRQLGHQPTGEEDFTLTLVVLFLISQGVLPQHHFMEVVKVHHYCFFIVLESKNLFLTVVMTSMHLHHIMDIVKMDTFRESNVMVNN